MDYKGLVIFSVGCTVVLMVVWNMMANAELITAFYQLGRFLDLGRLIFHILLNGILSFIGFLLLGLGLRLIIKDIKTGT